MGTVIQDNEGHMLVEIFYKFLMCYGLELEVHFVQVI